MREQVINTIKTYKLIDKGDNIVIGVSGGPDSMALLYILNEIKKEFEFSLHVAHVNHLIRGEEADLDQEYVREACEKLHLPFYLKRIEIKEYAKKHKLTEEEAGREIRYEFFNSILKKVGKGKIAVAHNKNDQAETLLMRFIRGTGIDGLKGMEYKNGIIIRPLLDTTRDEIEDFCLKKNINPRIDKTNLEPIYGRNKIRLELIPYIRKNFNEGIIDTLFRMSRIMEIESEFLKQYTLSKCEQVIVKESKKIIKVDKKQFFSLHPAIKSRVIRYCIEKINKSLKGIEEKHIKEILNLVHSNVTGKMINIPKNIRIRINYETFSIEKGGHKSEKTQFKYKININETTHIHELNSSLLAKVSNVNKVDFNNKDDFVKYFDYDKIKGSLYIRNREKGDRFIPLGMKGSKKVKDFFIDEKVPSEKRNYIPLVEDEQNIIWVIGYRMSDVYKITKDTKKVLILEYKTTEEE